MTEELLAASLLATLAGVALLRGIPRESLAALAAGGQRRTFSAGSVLIRQGAIGDCLHVLVRGRVRIERAHPQFAEPVVLAELSAGQTVGETGLLAGEAQPVTVTALEDTETFAISATALAHTLGQFPALSAALAPRLTWRNPLDFVTLRERPEGEARTVERRAWLATEGDHQHILDSGLGTRDCSRVAGD